MNRLDKTESVHSEHILSPYADGNVGTKYNTVEQAKERATSGLHMMNTPLHHIAADL